jgi:hypothetical protein
MIKFNLLSNFLKSKINVCHLNYIESLISLNIKTKIINFVSEKKFFFYQINLDIKKNDFNLNNF